MLLTEEQIKQELEDNVGETVFCIASGEVSVQMAVAEEGLRGPLVRYKDGTYSWWYNLEWIHFEYMSPPPKEPENPTDYILNQELG